MKLKNIRSNYWTVDDKLIIGHAAFVTLFIVGEAELWASVRAVINDVGDDSIVVRAA